MKLHTLLILLVAFSARADVHVSPAGRDDADGSAAHPVLTPARAVALARNQPAPHKVIVHGGDYFNVSLTLKEADSGLAIVAAPGEHPVFYGGVPLPGWRSEGNLLVADVPAEITAPLRMLSINGTLADRARYPAEGRLHHLSRFDVPWMSTTGGGWKRKPTHEELTTLKYKPGDIPARLDVRSAEVTVYHMWDESCVGLAANDTATHTLTFSSESGHPPGAFGVDTYVLWNIPQGLTRAGQWYHDRTRNRVVYRPRPDETAANVKGVIPTVRSIIRIAGTGQAPVHDITLSGLALHVTNVPLAAGGFGASRYDGAVSIDHARQITLDGLAISEVGAHAVKASGNTAQISILDCRIADTGGGGIYASGNYRIENCTIEHIGRSFPSSLGIHGGKENCIIRGNLIRDTPYTGIGAGGRNLLIENNDLSDVMNVLRDGGAIYIFGGKGCIIRGNYAHDITSSGGYGVSAYYLDETCEGCIVERNVAFNLPWPSQNHMAKGNTLRNNVFVNDGDMKLAFARSSDYTFEGNVLYCTGTIRFENIDAITTWSKNILHSGKGAYEGIRMDRYQRIGTAALIRGDTITDDPMFVDWRNRDLRYRTGSPALKLGLTALPATRPAHAR